jgi:hypothetical protein
MCGGFLHLFFEEQTLRMLNLEQKVEAALFKEHLSIGQDLQI